MSFKSIELLFKTGFDLMCLADDKLCAVPNCTEPKEDNEMGYCKKCYDWIRWVWSF